MEERWRLASFVPAFSAGYWAFAGLSHKCQTSDFIRNKPSSIFRGASQGAKGFLSRFTRYYYISRYKNVIPKYLENAPIDFAQTSRTLRHILEEQAPVNHFKKKSQCREMTSFLCSQQSDASIAAAHTKFSSWSDKAVVTLFHIFVLW